MKRHFIVLECVDVRERNLFNFHKEFISTVKNPKVLVILWTTKNRKKRKKYEKIIKDYFKDFGADVQFLEEDDKALKEKFKDSNVLYLPGGDTKYFLSKIRENYEVIKEIKNFKGPSSVILPVQ
jgi:peptidase E